MHIILFYEVAEDYAERRAAFRSEHLALARRSYERGELLLGGALADPLDGAVLVFRGPSAAAAEAFVLADPYVVHGLVRKWRIRKWSTVVGDGALIPNSGPDRAVPDSLSAVSLESLGPEDWSAVRDIYREGIATGHATFERAAPDWDGWNAGHLPSPRIVARSGGEVLGWAALSPVSGRCVYGGVAEVSIYVAERARGRGIGRALLARLVAESEAAGIWTLQAGIFPENEASIQLHRGAGFRLVGVRERLGRMDRRWRDVALMERRSPVAGA